MIGDALSETAPAQQSDEAGRTRFVTELDQNFSVLACAGAGKTTAVVDRIVNMARRYPERLARLVVVTYTNSAASEFKRRVFARLLQDRHPGDKQMFAGLAQAFFGTIHSFCVRLERQYQNELGLPPVLSVATERSDDALWAEFCHQEESRLDENDPFLRQLLRFCTWQEILDLARTFDPENVTRRPSRERPPVPDLTFLERCVVPGNSKSNRLSTIKRVERTVLALETAREFVPLPAPAGTSDSLLKAFDAAAGPLFAWVEEVSAYIVGSLAARYRQQCRSQGLLTFADQVNLAGELLRKPGVLDEIRREAFSVLLDEAQDTAGKLFQVLVEITRPAGAPYDSWPGSGEPPQPGRFSIVGDPRQAIYEHSGVDQYTAINEAFRSRHGGEVIELAVTQRCAREIVRGINQIFSTTAGQSFPDLVAAPAALEGHAILLPLERPPEGSPGSVAWRFEEEVKQVVHWLKQTGKDGLGIDSWSQVAILAPQHAWLNVCVQVLRRAGLEHNYYNQQISWSTRAAFSWPIALLYTLLYPWDRFERFGVYREIFGISDVELARHTEGQVVPSAEFTEAREMLRRLEIKVSDRSGSSLAGLLQEVIRATELRQRLSAINEPSADLSFIQQRALEADQRRLSLREFVDELVKGLDEATRFPESAEEKIQLITCQSAKGLEWDIVIPVGLGRPIETSPLPYPRLATVDGRVRLIWHSGSPNAKISLDPEAPLQQKQRILYVTLTRARHLLALPFAPKHYARSKNSFLHVVDAQLDVILQNPPNEFSPVREREKKIERAALPLPEADFSTAVTTSLLVPKVIRPHTLVDDQDIDDSGFEDGPSAYLYGRWWHNWAEGYPWASTEQARLEWIGAIPDIFGGRARREAEAFHASPAVREILQAGKWFQVEVPFSWPRTGAEWVEGVIDLVVGTTERDVWIVDWKTNQRGASESTQDFERRLRTTYLPQLLAYQSVLEQGLAKRVTRVEVYSTALARFVGLG